MDNKSLVLALETGIGGGSVSLIRNGEEIAGWDGGREVFEFEKEVILEKTDQIIKKNNIDPEEIEKVFVSSGPGSFTGLRIGAAIGQGLSIGWNAEFSTVSFLSAIHFFFTKHNKNETGKENDMRPIIFITMNKKSGGKYRIFLGCRRWTHGFENILRKGNFRFKKNYRYECRFDNCHTGQTN